MSIPIALQLYSVREDCKNDFFGTIAAVAKMGFQGVEFAGYFGHKAEDIKQCLADNAILCEGAHVGFDQFNEENFESTVEFHKALGCDWLIVPGLPDESRASVANAMDAARKLTAISDALRPHGLLTGYHCHHADMLPLDSGKSFWDIIAENTPEDFLMQYDTANGMSAGADPVQPILDWPGRGLSVHLKEWSGEHGAKVIGEGTVPFENVFQACESVGGTHWYVVEHEQYENMSPLDSVDLCLKNLRKMGK